MPTAKLPVKRFINTKGNTVIAVSANFMARKDFLIAKSCRNGYFSPVVATFGENLRTIRKARGMRAKALAAQLGVTPQVVSRWENNSAVPETTTLIRVAKALQTGIDDLLAGVDEGYDLIRHTSTGVQEQGIDDVDGDHEDVSGYQKFSIPVIAEGDASPDGVFWTDEGVKLIEAEEWMSRPNDPAVKDPRCYGVKVRGDSMEPVLRPGMKVIVSPNLSVGDGDWGYVQLKNGERLIKLVHKHPAGYTLESLNRNYPARFVARDEVARIHRIAYLRILK